MGTISLLVMEYFSLHDKGTTVYVLDWIREKRLSVIELYAEEKYKRIILERPMYPYLESKFIEDYIKYFFRFGMANIGKTLYELSKRGKLEKREAKGSICKWEYFYPENKSK